MAKNTKSKQSTLEAVNENEKQEVKSNDDSYYVVGLSSIRPFKIITGSVDANNNFTLIKEDTKTEDKSEAMERIKIQVANFLFKSILER